ncbi:MAG: RnfABCDGE type electron transport complex subunit D [Clostridia bacterium]|nr:RnfABCDGE type electron transport complex subunit D [Clostridia bacterium]
MMNEATKLTVSASPHVKGEATVTGIMFDVIIALCPAAIASVAIFGLRAALVLAVCIGSCVAFEYLSRWIMKKHSTIGDLSAVVTGVLLAFNLPASIPLWMCVIGSFVAIVIVKQLFGGIGQNFANPAITARIVLLVSFASAMTNFPAPKTPDAVTSATPLATLSDIYRSGDIAGQLSLYRAADKIPSFFNMFFGVRQGCMGEVCAVALLIGAAYLLIRRVIKITIPLAYIGTVAVFMLIASRFDLAFTAYELLGGGLILGAFFMATDYATSPVTTKGKLVFGVGCGILTAVIRLYGSLPEGVSYSILLMNIACPLIEKLTAPAYFGFVKKKKEPKEPKEKKEEKPKKDKAAEPAEDVKPAEPEAQPAAEPAEKAAEPETPTEETVAPPEEKPEAEPEAPAAETADEEKPAEPEEAPVKEKEEQPAAETKAGGDGE